MSSDHSPLVGGGSSFSSQLHIRRESYVWNHDDILYEEPSLEKYHSVGSET